MPPQQITLAGDVFRICLKPVYITRGEPQDASLGKLKIAHNPPLLYLQISPTYPLDWDPSPGVVTWPSAVSVDAL